MSYPHTNTGFSPFEVVLGRQVRGLLDVLKEGWTSGEMQTKNVVEWTDDLGGKMHAMIEIVQENEELAKACMKIQYDKKANPRGFSNDTLVLIITPDLIGKLKDCWDSPFEIIRKIINVTYELAIPSRRSKKRVSHINMLKEWKFSNETC